MNYVDQIYVGLIYVWSQLDKAVIGAATTAFVVATLRMKGEGHIRWTEALLCGVFVAIAVTGASFLLNVLGIPADGWLADIANGGKHVLAGFIGWYGTARTMKFVEDKVGGSKHEQEDN